MMKERSQMAADSTIVMQLLRPRRALAKVLACGQREFPPALHAQHRRPLQPSAAQIVEGIVRPCERIAHDLRLEPALVRNSKELAGISAGQVRDRDHLA